MRNFGLGVFITLVLSAGVAFTASKADEDTLRQARDRAEIEDLMWRYTRALDTANAEAYAAAYTPDGQFGTGANATKAATPFGRWWRAPPRLRPRRPAPPSRRARRCFT